MTIRKTRTDSDFVNDLPLVTASANMQGDLDWNVGPAGTLEFTFYCGSTFVPFDPYTEMAEDKEPITSDSLNDLLKALADVKHAVGTGTTIRYWLGMILYCARRRKRRPLDSVRLLEPALIPLFDACGPATVSEASSVIRRNLDEAAEIRGRRS